MIPGLRSTWLFSHSVKGCFTFPNPPRPATLRLCALTGKGFGDAWLCLHSLNTFDNVCSQLQSVFPGSWLFPEKTVAARGLPPGAGPGGTVLCSEGYRSVQHVSCFSHVTTDWHSPPRRLYPATLHAYTGTWRFEFWVIRKLKLFFFLKKIYISKVSQLKFQQVPDCFIVKEEVIRVELFCYSPS